MFGMGWAELLVVVAVAVLVIGPKDVPKIMYGLGRIVRRIQYIRFAFSRQFDDFLKEHDLEELRRGVNFEASAADEMTDEEAADSGFVLAPADGGGGEMNEGQDAGDAAEK